jgi:hypothetical protein
MAFSSSGASIICTRSSRARPAPPLLFLTIPRQTPRAASGP